MEKNTTLLDIIAPMNIKFNRNNFILGENMAKIYSIIQYPSKVNLGWLSKLTNIPSTVASITWKPIEHGDFIDFLSKNIARNRGDAETLNDPLQKMRAEAAANDGETLLQQIEKNGEKVGLINTCLMAIAGEKDAFEQISRKVESTMKAGKCRYRLLAFRQKQAIQHMSPTYTINKSVAQTGDRVAPLSAILGGFPFASSGYNDGKGYYLAKDSSSGLIVVDYWKRGDDRVNSNIVIMGMPGQGKSTVIKHLILSEYMTGTKLIIIDPEREYKDLCKALGGEWINAAGGSKGKINPLQVLPLPSDNEDENEAEKEESGMGALAVYMKYLEAFFKTYLPSLSDTMIALLNSELIDLYAKFNITWDTDISRLLPGQFPVIKDLYEQLKEKENDVKYSKEYSELTLLLQNMAIGSDSFLWNGYTTLASDSQLIVLDTHDLQESNDRVKTTEYLMLTTWMWKEISRDKKEKVMGIFDEAYLLIDPRVPQALAFLKNTAKRCRKYEGAVGIISHSVVDFLDPSVKMHGQALLDTPCFKLMLGCDGENLRQIRELYNLTDAEEELLLAQQRGKGLFFVGSKRMTANFIIPDYEWEYIGKGGGR